MGRGSLVPVYPGKSEAVRPRACMAPATSTVSHELENPTGLYTCPALTETYRNPRAVVVWPYIILFLPPAGDWSRRSSGPQVFFLPALT